MNWSSSNYNNFKRAQQWRNHVIYTILLTAVLVQVLCHGDGHGNGDDLIGHDDKGNDINDTNPLFHRFLLIWVHNQQNNNTKCLAESNSKEFPPDFLTAYQRQHGGILLHLIIATYACIALAIVCDYYFVPSLEVICYHLHIQEDIGGATLMCIGSSAPDIASSIMAIMLVDGSLGVGTVMGTTVFNLLLVLGVCGLVAYEGSALTWWPLVRDMTAYGSSIIVLAIVIADKLVTWQEASIMVAVYCLYFLVLWQNKRIEKGLYTLLKDKKSYEDRFEDAVMKKSLLIGDYGVREATADQEEDKESSDSSEDYDYCGYPTEPPHQIFDFPESNVVQIISWIITLPIRVIFFLTIPDLRRPVCQKLISVTFILGMVWIGVLTYILLWMVMVIGNTLGMPDSVIGITFVTFGTSVPDLLCSVMVMRRDKPDMAVSQAISSNVLGILIGLGMPWLIKSAASAQIIHVDSNSTLTSCAVTFVLVLAILLIFYAKKFVLDKMMGIMLVVAYVVYLIGAIVFEVFFRGPTCKH